MTKKSLQEKTKQEKTNIVENNDRRVQVSQTDVPAMSLDQALRVPRAIAEHYALGSVTPLQLAAALNMTPTSGPFRMLCGAAIAYGLTEGGYNAKEISLAAIGKRIVKPLNEGDDFLAMREAILRPRVLGEFLRKYDGASLPRIDIACNVLEEMRVPAGRSKATYDLIIESAQSVGFIREIKDKKYIDLDGTAVSDSEIVNAIEVEPSEQQLSHVQASIDASPVRVLAPDPRTVLPSVTEQEDNDKKRRVFVTHGKNQTLLEPIKKLLQFGELIPVISIQRETVSKPLSDKVMDDMRSCGAAIIHVSDEERLMDEAGKIRVVLNENVLIEIGAAIALYKGRFILLVKNGVELPSNLQGLYQVRYDGETLDVHATIKLMEAINELKNFETAVNKKAAAATTG